jgi:hypothetical protein
METGGARLPKRTVMDDSAALRAAIDLLHVPSRVRALRSTPLPHGIPFLLEIAAGDADAEAQAVTLTGRDPSVVRRAAAFFIEQILLAPDADSYRVLGASKTADPTDLRRNMALLLRWLHPDKDPQNDRSLFAARVTRAWNDLKTPERRAAYDAAHFAAAQHAGLHRERTRRNKGGPAHGAVAKYVSGSGHHERKPAPRLPLHRSMRRGGRLQRVLEFLLGRLRMDR